MELKGIDAKLFTMEPGSAGDNPKIDLRSNEGKKLLNKYPNDYISALVVAFDTLIHRGHQSRPGKIPVANFVSTEIGYLQVPHFIHLQRCYKNGKTLDKMPWAYPEIRNKLRACAQTVEDNRAGKCLVRLLKSLAIAAISAGVFLLLFWLLPKVEPASGLEFFLGLATVAAAGSCLAFSVWSVILLLGGFGPGKQQRQDLANAYIDAMRYIRYRILWFQGSHRFFDVPPYLVEAEKELRDQVKNVQDVLRRELGEDWLVPMETACEDNVDGLESFMADFLLLSWHMDEERKKKLEEKSNEIIELFGKKT